MHLRALALGSSKPHLVKILIKRTPKIHSLVLEILNSCIVFLNQRIYISAFI